MRLQKTLVYFNTSIRGNEVMIGKLQSIFQDTDFLDKEETDNRQQGIAKPTAEIASGRSGMQLSFFQLDDPVVSQIREYRPMRAHRRKLRNWPGTICGKYTKSPSAF